MSIVLLWWYCFTPLLWQHLDCFKNSWNTHKIRQQMNSNSLSRPAVRPDILYLTPDFVNSSVEDYKSAISDEDIMNQQQISNI